MKVRNKYEPVVDQEVDGKVETSDFTKATLGAPVVEDTKRDRQTNVGSDDLPEVRGLEDDRRGRKVVGSLGVVALTRGVADEVHGPAKGLLEDGTPERRDGRLGEGVTELGLAEGRNGKTSLLGELGGEAALLAGLGDEDLVTGEVAGRGVVATVGDAPRVVRNEKSRVEDPTNSVVDRLRGREGLVAALVGNDPDTSGGERAGNSISGVEHNLRSLVGDRREVELVKDGLNVESGVNADRNRNQVLDNVDRRAEGRALEAVRTAS